MRRTSRALLLGHRGQRWTLAVALVCVAHLGIADALADTPAAVQATSPAVDAVLVSGVNDLLATIDASEARIGELEQLVGKLTGEDLILLERQLARRRLDLHATVQALVSNVAAQEGQGHANETIKAAVEQRLRRSFAEYNRQIGVMEVELRQLRTRRDAAADAERVTLEEELTDGEKRLQRLHGVSLEIIDMLVLLGLDTSSERATMVANIDDRAATLAGRVELAAAALRALPRPQEPDDASRSAKRAAQERLDRTTDMLSATIALMARLDLDTVRYQQLLIQSTGEITPGIFNAEVLLGLWNSWRQRAWQQLVTQGPAWLLKFGVFLAALALFQLLSRVVRRIVRRMVRRSNLSQLMQETLVAWSARAVMGLGLLVALSQLGIQLGPVLAGLGIAGFVLGFALQETLSNFAAGAMLLIYRPFDIGDAVEAGGVTGKVQKMTLVSTTILTWDNQTLIVPNNKVWGDVIRNVNAQKTRRVDMVFGISYSDDIDQAERVLQDLVASHDKVLDAPEPVIKLHSLSDSSVDFIVRPWTSREDYWEVYWDLTRQVKARFDAENISIPFPQRDVHIHQDEHVTG